MALAAAANCGFLQITGVAPDGSGPADFIVAKGEILGHFRETRNRSKQLDGLLVPAILAAPSWVDFKSPGNDDSLVYCGLPGSRYLQDVSVEIPCPPGKVFAVYIRGRNAATGRWVVDSWEWIEADPQRVDFPLWIPNATWEPVMESRLSDYFDCLKEGLAQMGPFVAKPFYRPESDALYFYARDVPSYARRLNALLTVFLANDDDSLVGFKIEEIQRIVTRMERLGMDKFVIDERRNGIQLTIFLELALIAPPGDREPELERFEEAARQFDNVIVDRRELQLN